MALKRWMIVIVSLITAAMAATPVVAQTVTRTLESPGPSFDRTIGLMFDIRAARDVEITGVQFDAVSGIGFVDMRIYGRPGTHVGHEGSSAGWTLLATGAPPNGPNPVFPTPFSFTIPAGQTYSLYITSNTRLFTYRLGSTVGATAVSNGDLAILDGARLAAPDFSGAQFSPRRFIGTLTYNVAPEPVPTLTEWAMILLGLTLATGAVLVIQRRKWG